MRKIILLLTLLISIQAGYCASDKMNAIKEADESFRIQNQICIDVAKNFKADGQMSNFIRNECVLYQVRRQKTLPLIFPMTSNNGTDYKANYKMMMSEYAIKMDKEQVENLKNLSTEYCKYNQFRYAKSDPTACTRVNSLFIEF